METQKKLKPIEKKTFSLENFKKKTGSVETKDKPTKYIELSTAFQEATGFKGIPHGYTTLFRGFSNTGKSTALCETVVAAQKAGILPIIIDTENNLGRERLKNMGFDWDSGFFIDIDNEYILEHFGRKKEPNKQEATIEDLADAINFYLNEQEKGELPYDLLFAIDSLGTLDCDMTVRAKANDTSNNNMWNAGAFERAFKSLLNYRIPNSRKETKTYTNSLVAVQKIWLEAQPVGQPVVRHKGGDAFMFGARLIIHFGGKKTPGTKYITAQSKGKEISFGIQTNVEVAKNQIDNETGGISIQGDIISTPHGFIGTTDAAKNEYKKKNMLYFRDKLGSDVKDTDIQTKFDVSNMEESDIKAVFNEM